MKNLKFSAVLILLFFANICFGVADANLVAEWKCNDNDSNTTVLDSKGFSNGTATKNTNLIHIAGGGLQLNSCPNTYTVTGTLEPNAAGIYTVAGGTARDMNYTPYYDNGVYRLWYNGFSCWNISDKVNNVMLWRRYNASPNGDYYNSPSYSTLTVAGTPLVGGAPIEYALGTYTLDGIYLRYPQWSKSYDIWSDPCTEDAIEYIGKFNIHRTQSGTAWIWEDRGLGMSGWTNATSILGNYVGSGGAITGTAVITSSATTSSGIATVSGTSIIRNDYINSNMNTSAKLDIFRHNFTISSWIKTPVFSGSMFAGWMNNDIGSSVDFASQFMAMGYYWNQTAYSWDLFVPVPDSYKNQWTMFTCTVEQINPTQIRIRQYLNDTLCKEDVNDFILSRWLVQDKWGENVVGNEQNYTIYPPAIGAYSEGGDIQEPMGYGTGCAYKNMRIFNKALSAGEVQQLYNEAATRKRPHKPIFIIN